MPKYTNEEKVELLAASKRLGLGPLPSNVKEMSQARVPHESKTSNKKVRFKKETEIESRNRRMSAHALSPLPIGTHEVAYDVTDSTRYPEVVFPIDGENRLKNALAQHQYAMKSHGITPSEFKSWRTSYMLMTPEQLGTLLRVTGRTVRGWEKGTSSIPFSVWWVMHVTLQDPSYFLSRPGFHDYYIEYVAGVAYLCSRTHPDIRYTTTDLYVNRCAINEVAVLRSRLKRSEDDLRALTEENIALRKMFKTGSITAELKSMQEYIGSLMARINTADVMAFPTDVCQSQNEVAA